MTSIYEQSEYVVVNCGSTDTGGCGMEFAMPRWFYDETRKTGRGWSCPAGHSRRWTGKTTEQKLADAQTREIALKDQLHAAEAEAEQRRAQLLRDRHRFANGVCPCCKRSFDNVRRHMQSKHPEYDPADLTPPKYKCSCGRTFDTLHGLRIHQGWNRTEDWQDPNASRYARHLTIVDR